MLLQKGRLALALNDISQAIQLYEHAHRLDSANVTGMDLYALCLYERRDALKLNALAQQLMTNGGTKRPESWIAAALHCLVINKADKAEALADQACKHGSQHSMSFYVRGMILLKQLDAAGTKDPVQWFRKGEYLSEESEASRNGAL